MILKHKQEEHSKVREYLGEVVPEESNVRLQIVRQQCRAVALQQAL